MSILTFTASNPTKLHFGQKQAILNQLSENGVSGVHHKLAKDDYADLVNLML